MNTSADTIAAIATPAGAGGIGIVRVSGPAACRIAWKLCGRRLQPRQAHFVHFRDQYGADIDVGVAIHFPTPHSFTGEDTVELQAHGAMVVLNQLLRRCVELGARTARAGEFSERAFLNGKIDLTQAEAIADLISSQSQAQARAALRSLDGAFSSEVKTLQQQLEQLRLYIEAAIDFPEEEIDFLADHRLLADIVNLRNGLNELLLGARRGQRLRDGLHTVLIGRPNAGKSSVLNALARSDRAIVSAQPGTTRDLLREHIDVDGVALTIVDTAGLCESEDVIEQEGVRRARVELGRADLALIVLAPEDEDQLDALRAEAPPSAHRIVLHNKLDLRAGRSHTTRSANSDIDHGSEIHLDISALTGAGLDDLRFALRQVAGHGDGSEGAFSARTRHVLALERVAEHLQHAEQHLIGNRAGELAAEELRLAQQDLSELTGEYRNDDLLGAIFSSFCIGK
ncbi:MAG: tRNA uridine-5-carboxymethylaminomethyl(34) synthesis GTPase MnmE [Pseudomonadota bacterium]|nr:tRNA uridine-5-carboxymethylaminomethyl(34) synthesis GTPase MnmE [Pseudomonadota bacterium]